jgi:hypothetical protein
MDKFQTTWFKGIQGKKKSIIDKFWVFFITKSRKFNGLNIFYCWELGTTTSNNIRTLRSFDSLRMRVSSTRFCRTRSIANTANRYQKPLWPWCSCFISFCHKNDSKLVWLIRGWWVSLVHSNGERMAGRRNKAKLLFSSWGPIRSKQQQRPGDQSE